MCQNEAGRACCCKVVFVLAVLNIFILMIRMMITVVLFYALCWLPLHTITLVGDYNPDIYNNRSVPIVWLCFHWWAMSNSCYNPLIYLWMSPKFRTGLRLAIDGCFHRKQTNCASDEELYQRMHIMFPQLQLGDQQQHDYRHNRRNNQYIADEFRVPGSDT